VEGPAMPVRPVHHRGDTETVVGKHAEAHITYARRGRKTDRRGLIANAPMSRYGFMASHEIGYAF
jgi:hypothetical protein